MKKGQINIGFKGRRIAFANKESLVGRADRYSTIEYAAIVAYAAKAAHVPESSIEMAMEALYDAMNYFVLNGHSVQIPNLGTFSLGVRAKTTTNEIDFQNQFANNLRGIDIRFLPDTELKAMISNTSIQTSVNAEGYVSGGAQLINAQSFKYNSSLIPMNAGRNYAFATVTAAQFSGSRLSAQYLADQPVKLDYIKTDGTSTSAFLGSTYCSFSYKTLSINLKKFATAFPDAKWVKAITIYGQGNVQLKNVTFGDGSADPCISGIAINGAMLEANGTYPFKADEQLDIRVYGNNLNLVDVVKMNGVEVDVASGNQTQLRFNYTPAITGNCPLTIFVEETLKDTYNMSFGEAAGTVVTGVTAGGDTLQNGGSTNITDGSNYQINITGNGLADLTAANFVLPAGSSINITSQSATLIQATLNSAHAGDFKVVKDNQILFAAALVVVQTTFDLDGYALTSGGSATPFSQAVIVELNTPTTVYLKGDDVDELAQADFETSGVTLNSWDAATGAANLTLTSAGLTGYLYIKQNGTTIATLTLQAQGGDGGDGIDKD